MQSMNRSSQKYGEQFTLEDYQQTMQTAGISDYPINGILYPVIGFPSMADYLSLTVIFRLEHDVHFSVYEVEYVKIFRSDENGRHEFLTLHPAYTHYENFYQYVDRI